MKLKEFSSFRLTHPRHNRKHGSIGSAGPETERYLLTRTGKLPLVRTHARLETLKSITGAGRWASVITLSREAPIARFHVRVPIGPASTEQGMTYDDHSVAACARPGSERLWSMRSNPVAADPVGRAGR